MVRTSELLTLHKLSGRVPSQLSPKAAEQIGRAFATFLRRRKTPGNSVYIARGSDPASGVLRDATIRGLILSGVHVVDLEILKQDRFIHYLSQIKNGHGLFLAQEDVPHGSESAGPDLKHEIQIRVSGDLLEGAGLSTLIEIADAGIFYSGAGRLTFLENDPNIESTDRP
jgi:hypothetical protein